MEIVTWRATRSNVRRGTLILGLTVGLVVHLAAQSPPELIIRNGLVVTADARSEADVRIRNGTIAEIGRNLARAARAREIDARGMLILPGGVDPHSHLTAEIPAGLPSGSVVEDYTSGSAAALAGGVTTITNFVSKQANENGLGSDRLASDDDSPWRDRLSGWKGDRTARERKGDTTGTVEATYAALAARTLSTSGLQFDVPAYDGPATIS